MTLLLVDAAGRSLTTEWRGANGTTVVVDGVAQPPVPERYTVDILEVATGEVVRRGMDLPWDDGSIYWWTEGNYSCDCNRRMEFMRGKELDPDDAETECGDGAYRVTITLPSGEVVLREGP